MFVAAEATVEGESEFLGVMYDEFMRERWATQVESHETLDIELECGKVHKRILLVARQRLSS